MESGGFEGLACGAGLVNGEGLRGTGSWWGSAGPVLRSQGTLGQEELSRFRADGDQDVDVPTLAPDRSRCRLVWATGSG